MNFIGRTSGYILAKNGIRVNKKEAKIILELLYLVSKSYNKPKEKKYQNLNETSNHTSMLMKYLM